MKTSLTPRGRHAAQLTTQQRFWNRVDKTTDNGCWQWLRPSTDGYGRFQPVLGVRKHVQAHRWAYEQLVGPVPAGLDLDHLCRNRACVNPTHLDPVTRAENLLRGQTVNARNASRTECPQGHRYEGSNVRIYRGGRYCRACDAIRKRDQRAARKAVAA